MKLNLNGGQLMQRKVCEFQVSFLSRFELLNFNFNFQFSIFHLQIYLFLNFEF